MHCGTGLFEVGFDAVADGDFGILALGEVLAVFDNRTTGELTMRGVSPQNQNQIEDTQSLGSYTKRRTSITFPITT